MARDVTVTTCGEDEEFTVERIAALLGIRPERIVRWWIEQSGEEHYLRATID